MKKERDTRFIVGMILLAVILILLSAGFWSTVARQAELEKAQERFQEQTARKVIVLKYGDVLKSRVFLDMDTYEAFEADIPGEGIYNANNILIKGDEVLYGDILWVYGDNSLVEANGGIPRYPGITKMQRISRADLEQADRYQKILEERETGDSSYVP